VLLNRQQIITITVLWDMTLHNMADRCHSWQTSWFYLLAADGSIFGTYLPSGKGKVHSRTEYEGL